MAKQIQVIQWEAKDGTLHASEGEADLHDAVMGLLAVANEHFYDGIDKKAIVSVMLDYPRQFYDALNEVLAAKRCI